MVTYLVIGLVVVALAIMERAIRRKLVPSDLFSGEYPTEWVRWAIVGLIAGWMIDLLIWPVVIVWEAIDILKS